MLRRRLKVRALSAALALVLAVPALPIASVVAATCDPFTTPGAYDPAIPTAQTVLGFPLGSQEVTVDQSNRYLAAVDAATDRVTSAVAAVSVGGRALGYAIVGRSDRMTDAALASIRTSLQTLRDPDASAAQVDAAVASTPLVLWVAGNVHGNEESGADASLQALYELAARSDCVVSDILGNALVVILPIQNPDGRTEGTRRNLYGFDMNRDWFARTQPETDGKLQVVHDYPPMLFIDAHEFGLHDYFFPPNADPEYHETPDLAHDWINEVYSPAITAQFDRERIKYFHGAPYDLFATVFGDTVPVMGWHAAGMTFEKESGDPISERFHEHFTSIWASLAAGGTDREARLRAWHGSYVEARDEGAASRLEPNAVFERKSELYQDVPPVTVRGYLFENSADRSRELALLVRRLQRMDVKVYQLTAPLTLSAFHPYGDDAVARTFQVGSYWIPMAQGQKHWIQAMLNEETWIPVDVTYDVTAWSNPLLMNLDGGWVSEAVSPSVALAPTVTSVPAPTLPAALKRVALWEIPNSTRGFEAASQLRYLFEREWQLPYRDVTAADISAGLTGVDVLVVPDGFANYGLQALGSKGKKALQMWVNAGGRVVAWQGGADVVIRAGVSTTRQGSANTNAPGTLVRVTVDPSSPLAAGVGARDWVMFQDDDTLRPGPGGTSVATYPDASSAAYATSGLAINVAKLGGTSFATDEAVGNGRAILFASDPNFRAWTQGTQRMLFNALLGPDPASFAPGLFAGSKERAAAEKAAQTAADALPQLGSAIRIRVAASDAAATAKVLQRRGASEVVRIDQGTEVLFLVANPKDLSAEEHPTFALILDDLAKSGIDVRAASIP